MDVELKPRRLRILTGSAAEIESALNELCDEYTAIQFHYSCLSGDERLCVIMVSNQVLRLQALAQAPNGGFLR